MSDPKRSACRSPQGVKKSPSPRQAHGARSTHHPLHRGDGRPGYLAGERAVFDAAVQKAYGPRRKIRWMEVFAGEKANKHYNTWLPDETVAACREYLVSIKGP